MEAGPRHDLARACRQGHHRKEHVIPTSDPSRIDPHDADTADISGTPAAPVYRPQVWWVGATFLIVAAVSAVQTWLEFQWIFNADIDSFSTIGIIVGAHAIAFGICAVFFTIVQIARSGQTLFFGYRERYLIGVGYGLVYALITAVAAAGLGSSSFPNTVENSGILMTASLVGMVMPMACIVGGLAWHLLSRARGGAPVPTRKRRPIEDPE